MQYYPIFLRLAGVPCLVIGGGTIATQKVRSLVDAQAHITVISPALTDTLAHWAQDGTISHRCRPYRRGDLQGFRLAYAATNDDHVHANIATDAEHTSVLLNVVDRTHWCHFIVPSIMQQGDLTIATSTNGTSPALAKKIRTDLTTTYGPEYALLLQVLGAVRAYIAPKALPFATRQQLFTALVHSPLLAHLRCRDWDAVEQLLGQALDEPLSLAQLGLEQLSR